MRLAADENFNGRVVRALRRRVPVVDLVRVQDTALYRAGDPEMLAWAADEGRVVLSHDVRTLVGFARDRVRAGERMPGLVIVPPRLSVRAVVDDLALVVECSAEGEHEGQIIYLPL